MAEHCNHWRRCIRNPGVRASALPGDPAGSPKLACAVAIASCKRQHRVARSSVVWLVPDYRPRVSFEV